MNNNQKYIFVLGAVATEDIQPSTVAPAALRMLAFFLFNRLKYLCSNDCLYRTFLSHLAEKRYSLREDFLLRKGKFNTVLIYL